MKYRPFEAPGTRALTIAAGYLVVSIAVFMAPTRSAPPPAQTAQLAAGSDVWRAGNCEACHSLYGLGGHMGPDLTNIIRWRGAAYVQAMLAAGRPGMPAFCLSAKDSGNLLAYLAFVDKTGAYPQRASPLKVFGQLP